MKKLLFILMAVVVCVGLMGSAFAYFSDTETSNGNTLTAGTIDLALDGQNNYPGTALLTLSDIKPSHILAPLTLTLKNVGQNNGNLTIKFTVVGEADKPEDNSPDFEFSASNDPAMEMSADGFAALLYVQAATEDGVDVLPALVTGYDANNDLKVSLYELASHALVWSSATPPYDSFLAAGTETVLVVTLHLGDSLDPWALNGAIQTGVLDNRPQADGVEISVTATLTQLP